MSRQRQKDKGKNMKCENCGNEHDGSYGSGRFCSDYCRRSYSGKKSFEKRDKNWKSPFLNPEFRKKQIGTVWKMEMQVLRRNNFI